MIFSTRRAQARDAMKKSEAHLLDALRKTSGFRSTAEALAFVYQMKNKYPILHHEDPTAARIHAIPDLEKYFVITSLVDVLVSLQFQNKIALENLNNALK